jgi:glycerophosphoryl diester phosphodiesterase
LNEKKGKPLIIGHRGAYDVAPENTLKGFIKAIELGADYIEFDVHQTKDRALVLIHNVDILGRMGINTTIKQMNLKELKNLDFGEGEKIPELWELLELAKGRIKLLCEIKAQGIVEEVLNTLGDYKVIDSTIIQSFNIENLLKSREIEPSIELSALVPENDAYIPGWNERRKIIQEVIELGFTKIGSNFKNIDDQFISYCHTHNLKVFVYPLNTTITMKRFIKMNVDGIIVNSISKAKKALKQIYPE